MAGHSFTSHFRWHYWSAGDYPEVEIVIPPSPRLQVNYAMWGLVTAAKWQANNNIVSVKAVMEYRKDDAGTHGLELGTIIIPKRQTTPLSIVGTTIDSKAQLPETNITTENASNYALKIQLDGPRIPKAGLFTINEVTSWPDRSKPHKQQADLRGLVPGTGLSFRPWNANPIVPPYLTYLAIISCSAPSNFDG
ncbi:MAG: hypothetical protein Q9166_006545 [cf. Caloplaca sp. 2 TL-2023]